MMQFGMPTLIELNGVEENAALCRELGLSFVEFNMNLPEYQADRLDADKFRKIADEYGIYYTIHLDENMNVGDFNTNLSAAHTETVLQTIEFAKKLNIPILNMHMNGGVWFTLPDKKIFLFEKYDDEYMQKIIAFRDVCDKAISDVDMKICIEYGGYKRAPFLVKSLDVLLESPVFALTLDIGHNASGGFVDEPIIIERANRLCHLHIHDAETKEIRDHLPLGEGELDLRKYLDLAKTHNYRAVLEVKTVDGLQQSVNWLKERGYL